MKHVVDYMVDYMVRHKLVDILEAVGLVDML
jgi:hypothetical protein